MKIVLDANVMVAAFAARGLCESLFEYCLVNHEIVLSEPLLDEIRRNLSEKVKLPQQTVMDIERLLRENGMLFETAAVETDACRDADDLHVLGLIKSAECNYLVTGDNDLLVLNNFEKCRIVTPRQFWSIEKQQ
ncbi:MAG: putative toxin-antitoxin system toxin component, PIN family [Pirellulales bacterium]|nr:putative toxin-antitoxin system toxin component, PIN family [Pirellulales bacterium]